jgi:hypothetical protein
MCHRAAPVPAYLPVGADERAQLRALVRAGTDEIAALAAALRKSEGLVAQMLDALEAINEVIGWRDDLQRWELLRSGPDFPELKKVRYAIWAAGEITESSP